MNIELPEQIGAYLIIKELGRGTMGTVYLARSPTSDSPDSVVAIKVLASKYTHQVESLARFQRECLALSRLNHLNIVKILETTSCEQHHYIVMEYVNGPDLHNYLQSLEGKLSLDKSIDLVCQLLSALEHAHQLKIIHRDIKPANVLIKDDSQAVLTDFSIAKLHQAQTLTPSGVMLGTPDYIAPEQIDAKHVDLRCDLYSTGVLLYEMLTGSRPFTGDSVIKIMKAHLLQPPQPPHQLDSNIPLALSETVLKALAKKPEDRFNNAEEMRAAIMSSVNKV